MLSPDVGRVAFLFMKALDTPRSLAVSSLIAHGEWDQLVSLTTDSAQYVDPFLYSKDAAATDFLRKCAGLPTGIDTRGVAVQGFYAAEKQCGQTNRRLIARQEEVFPDLPSLRRWECVESVLARARRTVEVVLGRLPDDLVHARFGPGATFNDRGRLTTVPDKMSSIPTITSSAECLLPLWGRTAWARAHYHTRYRSDLEIVRGNRFTTVPKDATKDRGICIEPSVNLYFQLGVGRHIRQRLKCFGIDLEHGQSIHRRVACEASRDGMRATIDLSSASDTLSLELVRSLLPPGWWDLLNSLRSPMTCVDGSWVRLEKFSSMGNGFTFELETLVFYALSCAVVPDGDVLVYGDDIIVPTTHAQDVLAVLQYFGFTPNRRKTFTEGNFRESCGGDYFSGVAVRPLYLKDIPDEPQKWISLVNGIRLLARQIYGDFGSWNPMFRPWLAALDCIPAHIRRLRGPEELGDIVIHDDPEFWNVRVRSCVRRIRCYRPISAFYGWNHWKPSVVLASALYGVDGRGPSPRGTSGYKVGWVAWS